MTQNYDHAFFQQQLTRNSNDIKLTTFMVFPYVTKGQQVESDKLTNIVVFFTTLAKRNNSNLKSDQKHDQKKKVCKTSKKKFTVATFYDSRSGVGNKQFFYFWPWLCILFMRSMTYSWLSLKFVKFDFYKLCHTHLLKSNFWWSLDPHQ